MIAILLTAVFAACSAAPTPTTLPTSVVQRTSPPGGNAPTLTPGPTPTPVPTLPPITAEFDYHVPQGVLRNPSIDSTELAEVRPGDQLVLLGYTDRPYKLFYVENAEGVRGWLFWKVGMVPTTDPEFLALVPVIDAPTSPTPRPAPLATSLPSGWVLVAYEVTGTAGSVGLTLENETGGTEQREGVSLPYRKTFGVESGSFVYISAQNTGDSGTVQCKITVNGAVLETATSSGAYVIATCSGSAE